MEIQELVKKVATPRQYHVIPNNDNEHTFLIIDSCNPPISVNNYLFKFFIAYNSIYIHVFKSAKCEWELYFITQNKESHSFKCN